VKKYRVKVNLIVYEWFTIEAESAEDARMEVAQMDEFDVYEQNPEFLPDEIAVIEVRETEA
jgi:hypothetical protein